MGSQDVARLLKRKKWGKDAGYNYSGKFNKCCWKTNVCQIPYESNAINEIQCNTNC